VRAGQNIGVPRVHGKEVDTMRFLTKAAIRAIAEVIVVVCGVGFVSSAFAQSWQINSGRNVGALLPSETRKLDDGSTYMTAGAKVLVETEDPTYPITGRTMDCRWIARIPASGSDASCITWCGGMDKDGDLFSFTSQACGSGSYAVGPGTGKFAGASGGGTFETIPTADPALSHVRWKGTLQLK
jgi:hypothetical protein